MLSDLVRGDAYRKGIESSVTPDSAVLDMGAGSGIMSFFAAVAGARKVYAVERTGIVKITRELAEQNGLLNQIQIIQSDILKVQLPEKVDVLVSEWLGPFGVDENLLYPVLVARDRWLKENGKILPEVVTAWMAPAFDPVLDSDMFFWQSRPYGLNFQPVATHSANEIRYGQQHLNADDLLAEPQPMWRTDLYTFQNRGSKTPLPQLPFRLFAKRNTCSIASCSGLTPSFRVVQFWHVAQEPQGIIGAALFVRLKKQYSFDPAQKSRLISSVNWMIHPVDPSAIGPSG